MTGRITDPTDQRTDEKDSLKDSHGNSRPPTVRRP
jgi:hypothetical protein